MTTPIRSSASCCGSLPPIFHNEQMLLKTIEKVSLVFLSAISVVTRPVLFLVSFAGGRFLQEYLQSKQILALGVGTAPSCTQGVLEQITGVKLPAPIALAVNVAITVCHAVHHSLVFTPIIGLYAGMYSAKPGAWRI